MGGLPRDMRTIHKNREITISEKIMNFLGWEVGDEILIEPYKGKLIIENLSRTIKPLHERLTQERGRK